MSSKRILRIFFAVVMVICVMVGTVSVSFAKFEGPGSDFSQVDGSGGGAADGGGYKLCPSCSNPFKQSQLDRNGGICDICTGSWVCVKCHRPRIREQLNFSSVCDTCNNMIRLPVGPPLADVAGWGDDWNAILKLVRNISLALATVSCVIGALMMICAPIITAFSSENQDKVYGRGKMVAFYSAMALVALILLPVVIRTVAGWFNSNGPIKPWQPPGVK